MSKNFKEIIESLPKERQEKIHKRTEEMLKKYWSDSGKKWNELTKAEKIDSIKKQMKRTQEEDNDNGC